MSVKQLIIRKIGEKGVLRLQRLKALPLNLLSAFFPFGKSIVFESTPDFACNSYELFNKMMEAGIQNKYRIYWIGDENSLENRYPEVEILSRTPASVKEKIRKYIVLNRAKMTVFCNGPLQKYYVSKKQITLYLDHGSHLKECRIQGRRGVVDCDFILSQAPFFDSLIEEQYFLGRGRILHVGIPRNDQLFRPGKLHFIYPDAGQFQKIVAWMPTFRESATRVDSDFPLPLGIPILYSEEAVAEMNAFLAERKMLLVIKPHPVQDLSKVKKMMLSNIRFLTNEEMLGKGIQTNEVLASADAMLTDYSGIYYDYLLLDRPVGITLDDFEEYQSQHGFAMKDPLSILVGHPIRTEADMRQFFEDVSNGFDRYKTERTIIKEKTNEFRDGKSAERLYDFVKQYL